GVLGNAIVADGGNQIMISGEVLATNIGIWLNGSALVSISPTGKVIGFDVGIPIYTSAFTAALNLTNNGFIGADTASGTALDLYDGNDTILNSGTIVGKVFLVGGNDTFVQRGGNVQGLINAGEGNDTLQI